MQIGVNTRFLLEGKLEGLGRYTHELISRIVLQHPEHQFYFFFDRPFHEQFIYADNVKPVVLQPPARHPFLWYFWFEWALPRAFKKHKIDYFISPDSFLSSKSKVSQLLVVHDLAFEHFPQGIPKLVAWFYKKYLPIYCKKANRIVAVSTFTKDDVCKQYAIDSQKIDVILNGVSTSFLPVPVEKQEQLRKKLTQNSPYFVYLGAIHPRKNVARLLQAFDQFKVKTQSNFKLVLVGRKAWQNEEMEEVFEQMKFKEEVLFTGRLSDKELAEILGSAYALTYVPFFEGFGLPIIEAQSCGVPVICSNTSSMPEVAGDAAILVDPNSVESICAAMEEISKKEVHENLSALAIKNVARFSWDRAATEFWQSVEKGMKDANI